MQFSQDFIEKVRDANDVVEIISRHTVFKHSGRSFMALCPFPNHSEKSPSFSVSQEKQLYNCFGCGKSGNIYSFLRDYYGYSFLESIEYLAKKAGISLPTEPGKPVDRKEKDNEKKALNKALEFFKTKLAKLNPDHKAIEYLKNRGMGDPKAIRALNLGWAPDSWSELTDFLNKEGVHLKTAVKMGLLKLKKEKKGYYDLFRGRVIFPVFSFSGEILGFGGRVLGDEKPKYLNSSESDFFKKGRILYGQNWASSAIRQKDEALIVEGYTDWISLYLTGFKNVLGTMGTALTIDHGKQLKRWCSKVICIFDGDEAGRRASERALINLFASGIIARGVFLPEGEDPDSFLKGSGKEVFLKTLKNAEDLFLQLLDQRLRGFSGKTHEKIEVLSWSVKILAHLEPSSPLFAVYLPEVDARLRLGVSAIKQELKKEYRGMKTKKYSPKSAQTILKKVQKIEKVRVGYKKSDHELILLNLLMESSSMRALLFKEGFSFLDAGAEFLWGIMQSRHRHNPSESGSLEANLVSYCSNPEALTLTLEKPYSHLSKERKLELFNDCLKSIKKKQLFAQAKLMSKKIRQDAVDDDLKQFMEIQRKKRKH